MNTIEKDAVMTTENTSEHTTSVNEVSQDNSLDMLMDVDMKVTVELGRTSIKVRDLMNLSSGSIVELEKQAGEPVDLLVNGTLMAKGEVVVIEDRFAVRLTKMLNRVERNRK
jgi:flagellar motor switch protein FliN